MPGADPPRIFLVDGYALIYRAFFAMIARPLTTSKGENTSATWGVANFLLRLSTEYQPAYLAWVHDAGTSFRHEIFPDYKATREKLEPDVQDVFDRSVERVEELLEAFRVPLVAIEGYEADDVIGTLATHAEDAGLDAVIVSGDKDFYQLISDRVGLLNPGRGGPAAVEAHWVDRSNAADRLGVPPERVVDYLALVGDSSDNVPGVRGVGDKTARKLIEEFGALDDILAHAPEMKANRVRDALVAEADIARLSRDLVTIRRDVPVAVKLDALRVQEPDREALATLFAELEFHTLIPRLAAAETRVATHCLVTQVSGIGEIVAAARDAGCATVAAFPTDRSGRRARLAGLAIGARSRVWYLPFGHRAPAELGAAEPTNLPPLDHPDLAPLAGLLSDTAVTMVGHDLKRDWLLLRAAGVNMAGPGLDTMVATFLLEPGRRATALEVVALERLGIQLPSEADLLGKGKSARPFAEIEPEEAATFASGRVHAIGQLRESVAPDLDRTRLRALFDDVEMPLTGVLVDMEWQGVRVDVARLQDLSRAFGAELRTLEQKIYEEAGTDFNINSTPQLRHVLFEKLQLPIIKKTKTGPSTDADVLIQLADMGFSAPQLLLEYRELAKLRSTYVEALPGYVDATTGRIHTTFNQTGAATGRLSSQDPNLQNIPVRTKRGEEIRRCFVAREGYKLVVADYSQIELRILAHLSEDEAFISAFERGGDIHRETAAIIFDVAPDEVTSDMRSRAKTINFATIYGQGPFALSRQLGITLDEAKAFIATYFERFAGVRRFLDRTIDNARTSGYVETILGRRRYIPELQEKNRNVRAFGERTAMNSPMQGSAADLIKVAMIRLHAALARDAFEAVLLLQVHDELVLEAPETETTRVAELARREMEGAAELRVPLVADVGMGDNWMDAKG